MPASFLRKEIYAYRQLCAAAGECEIKMGNSKTNTKLIYSNSRLSILGVWCKTNVCGCVCAKSCCEIRASSIARASNTACDEAKLVATAEIVRARKGQKKMESGSIAAAARQWIKTLSTALSLSSSSFSLLKNPNQLPKIEARS